MNYVTFQPFVIEKISWSAQRFSLLLLKYSHSLRNVLVFSIFYKSNLSYCSHTFSAYSRVWAAYYPYIFFILLRPD